MYTSLQHLISQLHAGLWLTQQGEVGVARSAVVWLGRQHRLIEIGILVGGEGRGGVATH